MNRKTLTLIIASLCGPGTAAMGQDDFRFASRSNAGRIGDFETPAASQKLSDIPTLGGNRITDEFDNEAPENSPLDALPASANLPSHRAYYDDATPAGSGTSTAMSTVSCATPSVVSSSRGGLGWLEFDTLFWWGRGLTNSPTIVGGNSPTVLPTNPIGGGQDNPIGTDMLFGLRGDLGFWLDDCQNYGVGGRVWGLLSDGQETVFPAGGNSTGVSFFNSSLGQPDTYLVNFDASPFGANTGTIRVLNDLDVISGELYGKALLIGDSRNRMDLIGGYTFLRLDSGYQLQTSVLDGITNGPPPVGTVTTITDQFGTKNEFHGGHIGLSSSLTRGRVGFDLSGKVAMGNMRSTSAVSGLYEQVPPPPNVPVTENRGLFAQSSNIGSITQDNFTFIPEFNTKLRYRIGRAELGVGYSLIVFPDVAMASSQIDPNIDVFSILSSPIAPSPKFNTEAFFLHGLDLGLTFNF